MQCKLRAHTLGLVRNRPPSLTLKQIANDTGLNHNWLKAFVCERYTNPGVNDVEKLYGYLAGKPLVVA